MTNDLMVIRAEELLSNPTSRVPIVLCLDASGSMTGEPVEELNRGVRLFFDALRADPVAQASAEVAVVAFADEATAIADFHGLDHVVMPPEIQSTDGGTNLGQGVHLALDMLEHRKQEYRVAGTDYFQPWLVLMTDGQPTTLEHESAGDRARELEGAGRLVVFPIGIGRGADMNTLSGFSEKREPLRLQGLKFRAFFQWLSQSVVRVSHSLPGERIQINKDDLRGWAEL
jgi:uncharacterized protein YegL